MNKKAQLVLKIEGERIVTNKFKDVIKSFFNLIDEVSAQITLTKKPICWTVSVGHGSIALNLLPEPKREDIEMMPTILKAIENGVNAINNKDERPKYYSDNALQAISNLASIIEPNKEGINRIKIFTNGNQSTISTKAIGHIDSVLEIRRKELGSIEGKLEVVSKRRGYHFVVYDSLKNLPVICYFEESLTEKILNAFGRYVYVYGLVKYRKGDMPYSIQVNKFRAFRLKNELPTANDVLGILKDIN